MRFLFLFSWLLILATCAFADGAYQRTSDDKTILWNNDPKPGDVATWSGARDKDGYATGFGTVTWYSARQQSGATGAANKSTLYARYFGNMVRGKFNGPVNVHSKGKTNHALFVDGRRTTRWTGGPAPSWRIAKAEISHDRSSTMANETAKPEGGMLKFPAEGRVEAKQAGVRTNTEQGTEDVPAEGPMGKQANAEHRTHSTSSGQTSAIERRIEENPSAAASPVVKRPPNKTVPIPPASNQPQGEGDDSARINRPPPALLTSPGGDASGQSGTPPVWPAADIKAHLTKEEVIDLADAEARKHGYDPAQYQRPEPQYDPADQAWSLLYEKKPAEGTGAVGKHFSIAIHDKTKKKSFVPGR